MAKELILMINSEIVKEMRTKRGWSQEQLAQASGIGLRTIQRVESEGRASRETKVCLAATFSVSLEELDRKELVTPKRSNSVFNKSVVGAFLIAFAISAYGGIFSDELNTVSGIANVVTVATGFYIAFLWFFSVSAPDATPIRKTVKVGFIYSSLFLMFSSVGQQSFNIPLTLLFSALIFCLAYYAFLYFAESRKRLF